MLLILKIGNVESRYLNDINECLIHNLSNPIINKIVIFSSKKDIDKILSIDSKSKKVVLMRSDIDLFDALRYGKKNSKTYVIYSTPFVKFGQDLAMAFKNVESDQILTDDGSYYIYHRSLEIFRKRSIDEILAGKKISSNLNVQKIGYHNLPDFQFISRSWRLSDSFVQKKDIPKEILTSNIDNMVKDVLFEEDKTETKFGKATKIDVVIVSVNYNDFLIVSLENNVRIFDSITVVTSPDDFMCQKICRKFGVKCVVTERMYENGATFNKGKAINDGIASISDPDYILLLDADILVMESITESLEEGVLYGASRYMIPDYDSYQEYVSGVKKGDEFTIDFYQGWGFFQLFRYSDRKGYSESHDDASVSDAEFRNSFEKRKDINKEVVHLGVDSNWKGRRSKGFLSYEQMELLLNKKDERSYSFKICTFYYNSAKDSRREENLLRFLEQFEGYEDHFMIGVVDYGEGFDIPEDLSNNIIRIKGDEENPIWYKEKIINEMVEKIDTDYLIWMDCDLLYESMDWLDDLKSTVGENDFVQLFETINYLDEQGNVSESYKSIASSGFIAGKDNVDYLLGQGYKPGGSWIGKTSILKDKKLFEKMYVGGGDTIFLYGLFGIKDGYTLGLVRENNERIWRDAMDWIESMGSYRVGYLKSTIDHLYHGELKDRNYNGRYSLLRNFETDEIDFLSDRKIAVYTCISGNYDKLREVVNVDKDIDYICFTDQYIESETWEIRPIPEYLSFFENTKRARCIKILPHLFLEEYDISIWVDGNIQVLGGIKRFLSKNMNGTFCIPKHPDRTCVYEEAEAIKRMNKDLGSVVDDQISGYRELGYPEGFGMVQSNIIIRQHKDKECIDICEGWWNEVSKKSRRDQLGFNFSIWKRGFSIYMMDPSIICSEFFQIWTHAGKMVKVRKGYGSLKNYINGIEV